MRIKFLQQTIYLFLPNRRQDNGKPHGHPLFNEQIKSFDSYVNTVKKKNKNTKHVLIQLLTQHCNWDLSNLFLVLRDVCYLWMPIPPALKGSAGYWRPIQKCVWASAFAFNYNNAIEDCTGYRQQGFGGRSHLCESPVAAPCWTVWVSSNSSCLKAEHSWFPKAKLVVPLGEQFEGWGDKGKKCEKLQCK